MQCRVGVERAVRDAIAQMEPPQPFGTFFDSFVAPYPLAGKPVDRTLQGRSIDPFHDDRAPILDKRIGRCHVLHDRVGGGITFKSTVQAPCVLVPLLLAQKNLDRGVGGKRG